MIAQAMRGFAGGGSGKGPELEDFMPILREAKPGRTVEEIQAIMRAKLGVQED